MFRHGPRFTRFFAALCFLLAAASSSAQTTIHVPADQPSVQAGIDAAHNGDTVFVSPGTYNENIDFKGKSITLTSGARSYSDAGSIILQGDGRTPVVTIQGSTGVRSTLNGFTIQGGGNDDVTSLNCGGVADVGASLTVSNSIVTANGRCGVGATSGANLVVAASAIRTNNGQGLLLSTVGDVVLSSNLIEGNVVPDIMQSVQTNGAGLTILSDNTSLHLAANSLLLDHNIIRNNIADNGSAFEMQIGSAIKNLTLVNNAFYGNVERQVSGAQIYLSGPYAIPSQPVRTRLMEVNNTVVGGGQFLVLYFASSTIENNLFYNTNPLPVSFHNPFFAGLSCSDPHLPLDIQNNDIYNVGKQIDGGCGPIINNLAVEPQLRNIAGGDVREQPSSPMANAGDITAPLIPPADLDNKNRKVCNTTDIGAYELHPHPPIALTASANPLQGGHNVTFTAQLTGNCNVPTGVLTFFDGATPLGTGTLNGSASTSLTTAFLVVGQHTITAHYPGDFNFEDSTSNAVTETVTGFSTSTTLTVAPNPQAAFQPISLTVMVTAPYGTPSGTVTFLANGNALGTAPLNGGGVATLLTSALGGGTYTVVAVFNATTQYAASRSNAVTLVVLAAPSVTTLIAQPNPVYQGQTVTLAASAAQTSPSGAPVAGTFSFFDGGTLLSTAPVTPGQNVGHASFATNALAVGSHSLTAVYSGDGNLAPSTSPAVVEVVLASSFTVSLSPASLAFAAGQPQQVTVNLVSIGNYTGTLQLGTGALPQYAAASFSPVTVPLTAGTTAPSTLTLLTTAPLVRAGVERKPVGLLAFAALAGLPLILLRRGRRVPNLLAVLFACAALVLLAGCGSVRFAADSVAPGTYVIPITATDAQTGITQTANLTLRITR